MLLYLYFFSAFKSIGWFNKPLTVLPHLGWAKMRANRKEIEDLGNIYRIDGTVKFHIAMTQEDVINAVTK
jgi:hypothetical protein